MKTFELKKTKNGSQVTARVFVGNSIDDTIMLHEVEIYLKAWLSGYSNALTIDDIDKLVDDCEGFLFYDGYSFSINEVGV